MRTFDPWVGSKYFSEGFDGVRILILGESHYGTAGEESPSFTRKIVKEWGQEKRFRFFTMTQKLVSGIGPGRISDESRAGFWEHVAFYNFVQSFVAEKARVRPTDEMWSVACDALLVTVKELKPVLIIALGLELQRRLPQLSGVATVCGVQHPSSFGFKVAEWQPVVQKALAACLT